MTEMALNSVTNFTRPKGEPKVIRTGPSSLAASDRMARGLGWFSLGLGLAEVLMPGRITQALGMQGRESLVRAYGLREIGAGIMTLSTEKHFGLWSRLAGDGLDVATLVPYLHEDNPKRDNVAAALAAVLAVTLLDAAATQASTVRHRRPARPARDYRDRSGFPSGVGAARGAAARSTGPGPERAKPMLEPAPSMH
jgi:hypothetical protein